MVSPSISSISLCVPVRYFSASVLDKVHFSCLKLPIISVHPYKEVISWVSTVSNKNELVGVNFRKFNCSLLL